MKRAEIFSIGNELLRGIVQDTNSHWLAVRLTARGARVQRVTMLPDDPEVAGEAIREGIARRPDLIVTQGGLGPTEDDLSREAVSRATGLPLEPNADAEAIVARRYAELHDAGAVQDATLGPARLRMTRLPRGARALDNHVGAAPGVVVTVAPTTIVMLPGVPPELFWIFEHPLAPILDEVIGPGAFHEWTAVVSTRDESAIAELLAGVQNRHPDVYVKSRAKTFEDDDAVRVTLAASGGSEDEARSLVDAARDDVSVALSEAGVTIRE
jgi:molybdenum cofactor synthesis domain-containing protein